MTLKEVTNGPDWVIWLVLVLFAIVSVILLTGHGAGFIAGYNVASKEEKEKYDEKKLCRVIGSGMMIITLTIFIMAVGETVLPAWFSYVFLGVVLVSIAGMLILANTICKK